jgi:hypothetical protein
MSRFAGWESVAKRLRLRGGMAMSRAAVLSLVLVAGLVGCEVGTPETPREAVANILNLYEARDFEKLIRTRYADVWELQDEEQIANLVARFAARYADEDSFRAVVEIYREASHTPAEVSEEGDVATFRLKNRILRLYRMRDGRWGFRL